MNSSNAAQRAGKAISPYRRPLHIALVFTDILGRIPPLLLIFTWLALAVIASWSWARAG